MGGHRDGRDRERFRRLGYGARPGRRVRGVRRGGRPDGSIVAAGDAVASFPDNAPCTPGSTSSGFVSRRIGYGPPPPPASSGAAPSVSTGSATGVKATSATVTGTVNPNGLPTTYYFAYGKTTAYGSNTAAGTLAAASSSESVSAALSNLAPSTTYHFALVAANADGTTVGADETFKTSAAPPKLTVALHGVSSSYKISSLTAHGLTIKVACGRACSVRALVARFGEARQAARPRPPADGDRVGLGFAPQRRHGEADAPPQLDGEARDPPVRVPGRDLARSGDPDRRRKRADHQQGSHAEALTVLGRLSPRAVV